MKELVIRNEDGSALGLILDPSKHFKDLHPEDIIASLGLIPTFLASPDTMHLHAIDTINKQYAHGGGWHEFEGFTLNADKSLSYPGDPKMYPLVLYRRYGNGWETPEHLYQYAHGWLLILNEDETFNVSRLD